MAASADGSASAAVNSEHQALDQLVEIERTCRRDVELSEFCSRRPADPEVSELLAEACAKVSNAILDSGLRREHARARRALAWARQASRLCGEDSQNTSLALMCEGNALHRLGSWKCAADVFERLRDDKTYGKEAQEEAKGLREKLQKLEKGEGPRRGQRPEAADEKSCRKGAAA